MQNRLRAVPLGRFLSSQIEQGQCLRCFQGGRKIFINCLERSQSFLNINVTQSAILVENKRNGLDKE